MRDVYSDSYAIRVKEGFTKAHKFIATSIVLGAILSLGYFIFWLGAISDEIFFSYGRPIFEPLAKFLNFGDTSPNIYLNTSLILIAGLAPTLLIQYILDKIEESTINQYNKKIEKWRQKELQEEQKSYMARFDSIQTYSLCLSIDYEGKKQITPKTKNTLNKAIYGKMGSILQNVEPKSKITINDVLIFTSHNFSSYDKVYDTILKGLSSIKSGIEQKYGYRLIPSMTTDAYSDVSKENSIRRQHFEIQSFNFKNRALSTATFANKYKHLQHKKYAGIPIGEYVYFNNSSTGTYELNVIHKNLEKILS